MNGDLLLIEGYHSTYNITESVVKKGIREIGFIGDIHYARTNMDRYKGFCECLKVYDIEKQDKFCLTTPFDIYSYKQIIFDFLDSLNPLPEAFVCVSDYIAHFIQFYFSEHPDRIPEGIIITGFDASDEYTNVDGQITTAEVKTDHLGKRLASQALYRIANPDAPYELTYVRPDIVYRESRILI